MVYNAPNRHQVRLARLLCQRIPSFDLVRFTNSGTEATLNTIRAARAFTGRSLIAKAEGGYHGSHDVVSVSVRVNPGKAGERLRPDALPATEGLADGVLESVVVIPFNETSPARDILEKHKDQLAAVIVEPMLGSVGMLPATHEFLTMLREFATENGVVLIFDEVISFRIAPGGSQEYYGITPDMTSLGKIIGGGFAVGAFGGRQDIMGLYDPTTGPRVAHAGTFNANPATMLAGAMTPGTANAGGLPPPGRGHRVPAPRPAGSRTRVGGARAGHGLGLVAWHPLPRRRVGRLSRHSQRRLYLPAQRFPRAAERRYPDGSEPGGRGVHCHRRVRGRRIRGRLPSCPPKAGIMAKQSPRPISAGDSA